MVSKLIFAPKERVIGVYADYASWPRLFAKTIKGVRLVEDSGAVKTLEIEHVEGRVINVMSLVSSEEIRLKEWKTRYAAEFTNRFEPTASGTRYSVTAQVTLKGALKALAPIAKPIIRARIERLLIDPVKRMSERSLQSAPST